MLKWVIDKEKCEELIAQGKMKPRKKEKERRRRRYLLDFKKRSPPPGEQTLSLL
jgi:hypothetical protein